MVSKNEIKTRAIQLGADLCGFAVVDRFSDAPEGFHPKNIMEECKTVIVLAARFPANTLLASNQAPYTFVRHKMVDKLDTITFQLSSELESIGAVPIPSSEPYDYWDSGRRHGQGILSLKHAAVRAGLGKMGKNTLLINEHLGNMLWLGAVLVDLELESDPIASYEACLPGCKACIDSCPARALDGTTIIQKACRSHSTKFTEGGGGMLLCNLCRKICPQRQGIR